LYISARERGCISGVQGVGHWRLWIAFSSVDTRRMNNLKILFRLFIYLFQAPVFFPFGGDAAAWELARA